MSGERMGKRRLGRRREGKREGRDGGKSTPPEQTILATALICNFIVVIFLILILIIVIIIIVFFYIFIFSLSNFFSGSSVC